MGKLLCARARRGLSGRAGVKIKLVSVVFGFGLLRRAAPDFPYYWAKQYNANFKSSEAAPAAQRERSRRPTT